MMVFVLYTNINLYSLIGIVSYSYILERNVSFQRRIPLSCENAQVYSSTKHSHNKKLHDTITALARTVGNILSALLYLAGFVPEEEPDLCEQYGLDSHITK